MKKLLSLIAGLLLFSVSFAQVCPVSFSFVRTVSGTKRLYTIREFEPCADYATQIAIMTALAMTKQQFPWAIFLTGNTLTNIWAWGTSHWATQHLYTVQ